jgi:hypothetical protein
VIARVVEASWIRSTGTVVVLAALRGGLVRAKEGDGDQLPARIVAGFVTDAGISGAAALGPV